MMFSVKSRRLWKYWIWQQDVLILLLLVQSCKHESRSKTLKGSLQYAVVMIDNVKKEYVRLSAIWFNFLWCLFLLVIMNLLVICWLYSFICYLLMQSTIQHTGVLKISHGRVLGVMIAHSCVLYGNRFWLGFEVPHGHVFFRHSRVPVLLYFIHFSYVLKWFLVFFWYFNYGFDREKLEYLF